MFSLRAKIATVLLPAIVIGAIASNSAEAQRQNIYYVNSAIDNPRARSTDRDGLITLREAVIAANTDQPFGDAQAGTTYDLIDLSQLPSGQSTIHLLAPLLIDDEYGTSIHIRGPGQGNSNPTIDGRGRHQLFDLRGHVNLHIGWVDLANGNADQGGAFRTGTRGRISYAQGEITNCTARQGGAVFVRGAAELSMHACSLIDNGAFDRGGALFVTGNSDSRFHLITMARNASIHAGGAMFIQKTKYTEAEVQIRNSTISDNLVLGASRSTYAPYGGGIAEGGYYFGNQSHLHIPFEIFSSIVADNFVFMNGLTIHDDLHADVHSPTSHYNLIGAGGYKIGIENGTLNQVGVWYDPILPMLSSLGRHGGNYSRNLVPHADSPAINRGSSSVPQGGQAPYPYDQRGFYRIDQSDVGSIELNFRIP